MERRKQGHWHQEMVSEIYLKGEKEVELGAEMVAFWVMEEEGLSCVLGDKLGMKWEGTVPGKSKMLDVV